VLLYELLTGTTPFYQERFHTAGYDEMRRIIREEEPPRPSTRISTLGQAAATVSANRQSDAKKLSRIIRGELDWVVMKALEKDRTRRYETASALAADVQRHLDDEPVQACPPSAAYRLRKFAKRNRRLLVIAGFLAVVLVAATAVSTWQAFRATRAEVLAGQRLEAEKAARKEAIAHYRQARQAVDQMLTRVAGRLEDVPRMDAVQRGLLEDALRFYREFLLQDAADPDLRLEVAKAWIRVGQIHYWLGEGAQAETDFQEAIRVLEQLASDFPREPDYRSALADGYLELAKTHIHRLGEPLAGEQNLRRAQAVIEKLCADHPDAAEYQLKRPRIPGNLGSVFFATGRPDAAEDAFRQQAVLAEENDRRFPNYETALRRVEALVGLAKMQLVNGRPGEAAKSLGTARPMLEKLLAGKPESQNLQLLLVDLLTHLGRAQRVTGDRGGAEESFRGALKVADKLVAEFPRFPNQRTLVLEELKALGK
jgi:tetratricopeptide (TPR) repeat protein